MPDTGFPMSAFADKSRRNPTQPASSTRTRPADSAATADNDQTSAIAHHALHASLNQSPAARALQHMRSALSRSPSASGTAQLKQMYAARRTSRGAVAAEAAPRTHIDGAVVQRQRLPVAGV